MVFDSGVMPLVAQLALAGTAFFTSTSSTVFLHLVSKPYVTEIVQEDNQFIASRLNLLGKEVPSKPFQLSDIKKPASHPFASFQTKSGDQFYVFSDIIKEPELRQAFSKDQMKVNTDKIEVNTSSTNEHKS